MRKSFLFDSTLLILFIHFLCVKKSFAGFDWSSISASDQTCSASNLSFCVSCGVATACLASGSDYIEYDYNCGPGESCSENGICEMVNTGTNMLCGCTNPPGDGVIEFKSDPYNSNYYIFCNDGIPSYRQCPNDDEVFDPTTGNCHVPISTTSATTTTLPTCSSPGITAVDCCQYITCPGVGDSPILKECPSGQFFNSATLTCIAPTPFECTGSDSVPTGHRDPYDCERYYICIDSNLIATDCCLGGEYYNEDVHQCEPNEESCVDTSDCKTATCSSPSLYGK